MNIIAKILRGMFKTLSYFLAAVVAFAAAQSAWAGWTINDVQVKTEDWSQGDWVDIVFGNNSTGILTNNFAGTVTVGGNLSVGRSGDGAYGEYVQNAGTVNVGIDLIIGFESSLTAKAIIAGGIMTVEKDIQLPRDGNCIASLEVRGDGSLTGNGQLYLRKGTMTVDSGTVNINDDFNMGAYGAATLTINGGSVTVAPGKWIAFYDTQGASTITLNGGTLTIPVIGTMGGTGTVVFNGGTLAANNAKEALLYESSTVKVKAGGGTINAGGNAIDIKASISEDTSSQGGGMKFCGGGTVTLSGAISYTGGTTIEAGTTVKVDTAAKKDAILGSGQNTLKFIPTTAGTYTLVTITGEDMFTDGDELKASVADGFKANAVFALSEDKKSLTVTVGSISTLVFPGATLADLATHTLRARMGGSGVKTPGVEATFFNRIETKDDDGVLANVTYQLQAIDESSSSHRVRAVKVAFTEGAGGVYAGLVDGDYSNKGNQNAFGTEPLDENPGKEAYEPYDFRLVEPARAISVNFTEGDNYLDTSSSVRYGAGDYAVPYSAWVNMPASKGKTEIVDGATITITKTSGGWFCANLSNTKDLRCGYLDDGENTVVIDVTNIPYEFYRIVTYHATDNENVTFGYVKINDTRYTGITDATVKGNSAWGATGSSHYALGFREGVNYLVSDVMSGDSVTITGHKESPARGCIAAIQIVEVKEIFTATIDDGDEKAFSSLNWDKTLPDSLVASDEVVINVSEDTELDIDRELDVNKITFNVAEGKTLTLAGGNIAAANVMVTGSGTTVVDASQIYGVFTGDGKLVTDTGAMLAIMDKDSELKSIALDAFDNNGIIDLTGTALTDVTLNLASDVTAATTGTIRYPDTFEKFLVLPADQSIRSLDGYERAEGLPEGATYCVVLAETREEFGKGSMAVTNIAEGVNVRVVRPDGTSDVMTPVDGIMKLDEEPQIYGAATAFDITYTNTVKCAYQAPGLGISSNWDTPMTYNNDNNDKSTGAYIKHHPFVQGAGNLIHNLENFTIVLVGTMSPSRNTQFFHMGTTNGGTGLLITTTENNDEVLIAKNTGPSVDAAGGVKASVPNAATARHAYVITKTGTLFEVWVDGVKRGQFDGGVGFKLSAGGMQVGSDYGGKIKDAKTYEAVPLDDSQTGCVNVLRMFDYVISEEQAEAVFAEYPYASQGGLYTRTIAADGTFSQTDAWEKDGEDGAFDVPAGTTVDGVFYNPSATLTVDAAARLDINADVVLDTLTVNGDAALTFKADGAHTVTVAGSAIINSPVTVQYGALNISGAPVQLGSSGSIEFDMSGFDMSGIYVTTRIQLTGLIERNDERISYIAPSDDPERTTSIVYNEYAQCYDFLVTMQRHYVVAEGKHESLQVTDDTTILGAGGFHVETLAIPGKLTFDPVKTPIYVAGELSFGDSAKFALASAYSRMTLGRVVLLTYKEVNAVLPENLNVLFDASSIASGAAYAVTSEDAPDPTDGRKQLVLTVGDYANEAKEIRILPVGDSITQGVAANIGETSDKYPQYRSTIAARLAANGYKPKFFGVWKHANYDAAHVRLPEDWAWHSGISAERIIAGGNVGGVRDNMHVYLDIAGDVNVITFLIGTNDIGNGPKTGEETYNAFTNVVFATAAQRPNAKIIGATILDRGDNAAAKPEIAAFNTKLREDYAAGNLPGNFVMLDLYGEVPLAVQGNFLSDRLHFNWKGCVAAGEAFAGAIMSALPLTGEGAITGESDPTVTDEPQTALGAANIPELADYRSGMTQVFTIDAAASNCFKTSPYTTVNDSSALSRPVSKAGYYMELVRKGTNRRRYVWVDFDAAGKTLGDIDFPWEGESMDFVATKLHVYSNDPYIHNVAAGDDSVTGAVEGMWRNYIGTGDNGEVPADVVDGGYGWNDTLSTSESYGWGCFQVHRILSGSEAEVLFAWNKWGGEHANSVDEIGIGSFGKSVTLGADFSMDYTFTSETADGAADMLTANAYSVRRVEIWAELEGEVRHGVWSGLGANSDFDTSANWEDGVVPSAGEDIDFSAAPPGVTIAVTGNSAGRKFGTAKMGANPVTFAGNIAFAAITDTSKIAVAEDSTVTLEGDLEFSGTETAYVVYSVAERGRFVVTGDIKLTENFGVKEDGEVNVKLYHSKASSAGAVEAHGLVNNAEHVLGEDFAFRLFPKDKTWTAKWIIGEGGISGKKYFYNDTGYSAEIRPKGSVLSIKTTIGNYGALTLNTVNGNGESATIVIGDDEGNGHIERRGPINITGTGKVIVNAEGMDHDGKLNPVNIEGGAIFAVKNGKGRYFDLITVNSGATLQVAESGTFAHNNGLSLADGAILGFNFTQRQTPPVMEVAGSVTANGIVKVKVGGVHPTFLNGGRYVLASGGKFGDTSIVFDKEGSAKWVKNVSVDANGDIVVDIKAAGMRITVR